MTDDVALQHRHIQRPHWRSRPCKVWTGAKVNGYGVIKLRRKLVKIHRATYERVNGPIPDGLKVLHHCDNKPCYEELHLFIGTDADNARDRDAKGRQARGVRQGLAKLTDDDVRAIRRSPERYSVLAGKYGVTKENISFVRRFLTWKHVEA